MTTMDLDVTGPYELAEVATMGFGHRDERTFDGVMRMAFCLDGDYERPVGVAARQDGPTVQLTVESDGRLTTKQAEAVRAQVARAISVDHDGEAFHELCESQPPLATVHARAPGFRPANFYSPYEALVWAIISARRARTQGIGLRTKLAEAYGTAFVVAGIRTLAVPTPSQLLTVESVPGLPADRIPRLHAVAEAAQQGRLSVERLRALTPDEAKAELQELPGVGPFYSALVVVRALGHADVLSTEEGHSREAIQELYGIDHELSTDELTEIAEAWRPFRTWVTVMLRALSGR